MGWAYSIHRKMRKFFRIYVGKPEVKRPLGKSSRKI